MLILCTACTRSVNTHTPHPRDPWERSNRNIHKFNQAVDNIVYKPVAKGYIAITPKPVRQSVTRFFNNLREIPSFFNDLLQANVVDASNAFWRFTINSSFGLLGFFDIAETWGLKRHYNDFGITLARWGDVDSPYFVIPLLGPSTLRDAFAFPVDTMMTVYLNFDPVTLRYGLVAFRLVDIRAQLIEAREDLNINTFDEYAFQRDVYLQRRDYLINPQSQANDMSPVPYIDAEPGEDELSLFLEQETQDILTA